VPDTPREFDVVLFGATGYTGQKVADYLARNAPPDLKWAIAGRTAAKLAEVKARLSGESASRVGVIEASVDDPASLARMTARTRVLVTTVGPFIDYGEPVAAACVESGTDYVDSTGEPAFVERLIERYDARAKEKGVRLVPSSGFDSVIADMGVYFAIRELPSDRPMKVEGFVKMKAAFSGGTERSAIKSLGSERSPPLSGPRAREVPARIRHVPELERWAAPFPTIDASVVVRSATAVERYGPDFRYSHYALHPSALVLVVAGFFFGIVTLLAKLSPFRALLLASVKKPGQGPADQQLAEGWFSMWLHVESDGKTTRAEVSGGEPAYVETSKILAESALCLVLDRGELPVRAGVLTPVSAMAEPLLARLTRAGIRFKRA